MVVSYMVVPTYDLTILATIKLNKSLVLLSILCSRLLQTFSSVLKKNF